MIPYKSHMSFFLTKPNSTMSADSCYEKADINEFGNIIYDNNLTICTDYNTGSQIVKLFAKLLNMGLSHNLLLNISSFSGHLMFRSMYFN